MRVIPEDGAPWLAQNSDAVLADMQNILRDATRRVQAQLEKLEAQPDDISTADMSEMQRLMNQLAQLSESSTSIVSEARRRRSLAPAWQ